MTKQETIKTAAKLFNENSIVKLLVDGGVTSEGLTTTLVFATITKYGNQLQVTGEKNKLFGLTNDIETAVELAMKKHFYSN